MVRNTWECFAPSVFSCALRDLLEIVQSAPVGSDSLSRIVRFDKARARCREREGMAMNKNDSTIAQQLADAASRFQSQRTGHSPTAVTAVLLEDMIVVTLDDALTPAEQSLSKSSDGAARVQEFHRQLFANSSDEMRQEIQRITGRQVRETAAEIESTTGAMIHAFTTGAMVQVYLLMAEPIPQGRARIDHTP